MALKSRPAASQRGPRGQRGATGKTGTRGPRGKPGPARASAITRAEFDAAAGSINRTLDELKVQFHRMAQIQAELDELKRIVARLAPHTDKEGSEPVTRMMPGSSS